MNKKISIKILLIRLIVLYLVFINFSFIVDAQQELNEKQKKPSLASMGILSFPDEKKLDDLQLDEKWLHVKPLSFEDINEDFSNIDDLQWLKPVAHNCKVFLLGESHYYSIIHNLAHRILFALNKIDRFSLLLIEHQYSISGYLDYYTGIENDKDAEQYYTNIIYDQVTTKETYQLLEHIRRWNKINPDKRIHIGAHDIEHNYKLTLEKIIQPYFQIMDSSYSIDVNKFNFLDSEELMKDLKKRLEEAKKKNVVGEFPFLTPDYIDTVLENLQSYFYTRHHDFNYFRQRAIIRNITDPRFFGRFIRDGKIMIHGGAYHTPTHNYIPDGGNFFREGSYLSYEFEPTRGKTYSLYIQGLAYKIGSMADVNLSTCLHQGSSYRNIISKFKKAFKEKLVTPEDYYLFETGINRFDKLIFKVSYEYNHVPLLFEKIDWEQMISKSKEVYRGLYNQIRIRRKQLEEHDAVIYVTRSPITVAIQKKQYLRK